MKTKLLILLLLLLAPANKLLVQEIPDCSCVPISYPATGQLINQDSAIVIDTCGIWYPSTNCDSVYWNNMKSEYHDLAVERVWAKKYWIINFKVDAIPIDSMRGDTMLYVSYANFDSINYPEILNGFKQIETKYGSFKLRKVSPQYDTGFYSREFVLTLDNYANLKEIAWDLYNIGNLTYSFDGWPYVTSTDISEFNKNHEIIISPNPANEYIEISVGVRHAVPVWDDQMQICNVYGEQMYNFVGAHCNMPLRIDISNLPIGMYFVRFGNTVKSFVVLR